MRSDHNHMGFIGFCFNLLQKLLTIDIRQFDIQKDQIVLLFTKYLQAPFAVCGLMDITYTQM